MQHCGNKNVRNRYIGDKGLCSYNTFRLHWKLASLPIALHIFLILNCVVVAVVQGVVVNVNFILPLLLLAGVVAFPLCVAPFNGALATF